MYELAKNHIRNNREAIDKLIDVVLEKETFSCLILLTPLEKHMN